MNKLKKKIKTINVSKQTLLSSFSDLKIVMTYEVGPEIYVYTNLMYYFCESPRSFRRVKVD